MKQIYESEGKCFYLNCVKSHDKIVVDVTDLKRLWKEILSEDQLEERFKKSNPLVKSSRDKIFENVASMLIEGNDFDLEEQGTSLNLSVMKKLQQVKLKFNLSLTLCTDNDFYNEVTLPLVVLINQLTEQQKLLCSLLNAKDLELREYKLEGADISRRNIQTGQFNETSFQSQCTEDFLKRVPDDLKYSKLDLHPELRKVFSEICRQTAKHEQIKEEKIDENEVQIELNEEGNHQLEISNEVNEKKHNLSIEKYSVQRIKKPRKAYFL